MKKHISIAIDGPSGAGKSSLAKAVAQKLGCIYIDTGAMYRAVALFFLQKGIDFSDENAVNSRLSEIQLEIAYRDGTQHIFLNGADVSSDIRQNHVSVSASAVSKNPAVRLMLLSRQREMAASQNVVMDGRDIGTVVLPDADVKIFLTASDEARAKRRYEELGGKIPYATIAAEMKARDENDKNRAIAPAVPASDAIILDNSGFEPCQTLAAALRIIESKL